MVSVNDPKLKSPWCGVRRRRLLLGLFLLLLALGTGEEPRGDAGSRHLIARQLLSEGTLHQPEPHPSWGLVLTPKGWTSYFGIGQTLLFIPFEVAGMALSAIVPEPLSGLVREFPINFLYCPLIGMLFFVVMSRLLQTFGVVDRDADIASLLFILSTVAAPYVAQSHQEEIIAAAFVCLCLRSAWNWSRSPNNTHAMKTGLFAGTIILFRFNAIFAFIPVAILFVQGLKSLGFTSRKSVQAIGAGIIGGLGPAIIHAAFAYLRFGNPLSTGYDFVAAQVSYPIWQPVKLEIVSSLLFGLGKGLFIFSPLLAIALWGMWIDRRHRGLLWLGCLAALLGNVILSAAFFAPDGCWSWGPRYQVHLLPLFAYPAFVGMRDLYARRNLRTLVPAAIGLGLFFQFCALFGPDRLEYTQLNIEYIPGCHIIQEQQFARRLENIATVARHFAREGDTGLTDLTLDREMGYFWVIRLGRPNHGWIRIAVIVSWLTIFSAALIFLFIALVPQWTAKWISPVKT